MKTKGEGGFVLLFQATSPCEGLIKKGGGEEKLKKKIGTIKTA